MRGGQGDQPFAISLIRSAKVTVEPSSQSSVMALPDMQTAGTTGKPCCRILVSIPISYEPAGLDPLSGTRAIKYCRPRFVAKRRESNPLKRGGVELNVQVERRIFCLTFEMNDQMLIPQTSRFIGISGLGEIAGVFLSCLTLINTKWLEKGQAPGTLIATKYREGDAAQAVEITRPVCPYPEWTKYNGSGDPNAAASFVCTSEN